APQKDWEVNQPAELAKVLQRLEAIQKDFNAAQSNGKKISIADLIVLGGSAAVEAAAKKGGNDVKVTFTPGRTDATQESTDVNSFAVLEPSADGFRNFIKKGHSRPAAELLIDRANLMTLTAPEMTVLVGGMRVLNANFGQSKNGVFTKQADTLSNDFFVNLLDMGTKWQKSATAEGVLEGRAAGEIKWTATVVDLVFGSNSQLRALAEVYASSDAKQKFAHDFAAAWIKVMNLDRFDLA
ncbi:MAG: catalase-peroxidase, partial [Candidatus Nitrotoga sp.]|nr:catalase-peroxidase [Candidatus Nitrotoga sp.]